MKLIEAIASSLETIFGYAKPVQYNLKVLDFDQPYLVSFCCAGPSTSCPDAGPICDPRTAIDLHNITGLEGPQICQVNIPAANWTSALATCCVGNSTDSIHVQDDCTRYCSSDLDQSAFGRCIHSFLPEGYIGYCQQVSDISNSTGNVNNTSGAQGKTDTSIASDISLGWGSMVVVALSFTYLFV